MRSPARQRGASAVFVAISMVASIAALGMALDLGRLYFTHRELQLIADMAAMDAARSAGGCLGKVEDAQGSAAGEAAASLQRNNAPLSYLTAGAVEIGRQEQLGGVRIFVPDDSTRADSVRVTLRRPIPSKLIPIFSSGPSGVMTASAAAIMRPIVSFDVGSGLAGINSRVGNDLLQRLLGANAGGNIGLVDSGGLANVTISLGDLAAAANAGSVEDFLDTQTTAPALLGAIADALSTTSDAAVKTALTALASGGEASKSVVPREILGVPAGSTSDQALIDVGTLITTLGQSTNGDNLFNLHLPVSVPLLAQGTLDVTLIELAKSAIGPPLSDAAGNPTTVANTAQGIIKVAFSPRPLLGTTFNLQVYAQVAAASGAVSDLQCHQRGRPQSSVTIDTQTSAGRFGIGDLVDLRAPDPTLVTIATLPGFDLKATFNVDLRSGGADRLTFEGPFPAPPQTIGSDPGEIIDSAIDNADFDLHPDPEPTDPVLRTLADTTIAELKPVLRAVMHQLAHDVITPAAGALGANLGTARVTVRSVNIDQPEIYTR